MSTTSLRVDADLSLADDEDYHPSSVLYGGPVDLSLASESPPPTLTHPHMIQENENAASSYIFTSHSSSDTKYSSKRSKSVTFSQREASPLEESTNESQLPPLHTIDLSVDDDDLQASQVTYGTEIYASMSSQSAYPNVEVASSTEAGSVHTQDTQELNSPMEEEHFFTEAKRLSTPGKFVNSTSPESPTGQGSVADLHSDEEDLIVTHKDEKYTIIRSLKPNTREVVRAFPDDGTNYASGVRLGWTREYEADKEQNEFADEIESQVCLCLCDSAFV
jgi:hypothetical protein